MFTLEETVVKYAWNEADGCDIPATEDIRDLAPRPFLPDIIKARQKRKRESNKDCPRHAGCWKTHLDKLLDLCRHHFTEYFLESMTTHLEAKLCSCDDAKKNTSSEFNMPIDTFEMEIWDLYTYFLNLFNTRLKSDHPLQHFRSAIFDTVVHCVIFMEVHRYFFLQGLKSLFQLGLLEDSVSWNDTTDLHTTASATEQNCTR